LLDAPHIVGCTFKQVFFTFRTTQAVSHSHNMWMKVGGSFPSGRGGLWWEGWLWWQIGDPCPQEGGQFLAHLGAILYVVMCILQSYKLFMHMGWHGLTWRMVDKGCGWPLTRGDLWCAAFCLSCLSLSVLVALAFLQSSRCGYEARLCICCEYSAPLHFSCFTIVHNALGQEKSLLLILLLFME
jgi:hypothetical protein